MSAEQPTDDKRRPPQTNQAVGVGLVSRPPALPMHTRSHPADRTARTGTEPVADRTRTHSTSPIGRGPQGQTGKPVKPHAQNPTPTRHERIPANLIDDGRLRAIDGGKERRLEGLQETQDETAHDLPRRFSHGAFLPIRTPRTIKAQPAAEFLRRRCVPTLGSCP